jgi:PAP2 superfamily
MQSKRTSTIRATAKGQPWLAAVLQTVLGLGAITLGYRRKYDDAHPLPGKDWIDDARARLQPEDWVILCYGAMLLLVVALGNGPRRSAALLGTALMFGTCLVLQWLAHTTQWKGREFLRRLSLVVGILGSFLELQYVLPTAPHIGILDAHLVRLDQMLFGYEPAVAWQKYVSPGVTNWFSFFYFNYYTLILAFLLPFVFRAAPGRFASEFTLGFTCLFCLGQTVYLMVPAYGPYAYLAQDLHVPLTDASGGPFWWKAVRNMVDSGEGSARTDVFPSLHTAVPTFLTIFAFRHRHMRLFRFTWPVLAFTMVQIIGATMYLRWHYLIDILAGITLAGTCASFGHRFVSKTPAPATRIAGFYV